jgi:acyl-CoA reductase-like NAD-dependent aldehyde dehydrogenase
MKILKSLTVKKAPIENLDGFIRTNSYDPFFKIKVEFASDNTIKHALRAARIYINKNFEFELPNPAIIEILKKLSRCIELEKDLLAEVDARWTSRSWKELNYFSIPKAVETINWFSSNSSKIFKRQINHIDIDGISSRIDPLGVIVVITPWNDPLVAFSWKVIPPLLAGNCVIWKPSENCIESAYWVVKKMYELGLPRERLQLILGDSKVGKKLIEAKIDGIAFTGSSKTAKIIASSAYKNKLVKLHMEAGGKGCAILDVDSVGNYLEKYIYDICTASFSNQGQICSAPTILFVPKNRLDIVIQHFKSLAKSFGPDNPLDREKNIGGLISAKKKIQLEKILKKYNAIKLTNSSDSKHGFDPTLVICPDKHSEIITKELFGPIIAILPYIKIDDAIKFINDQDYGLANGIYSHSKGAIDIFSKKTYSGILHINSWGQDPVGVPFGGIKNSGFGKEKCAETLLYFTNFKTICQL